MKNFTNKIYNLFNEYCSIKRLAQIFAVIGAAVLLAMVSNNGWMVNYYVVRMYFNTNGLLFNLVFYRKVLRI